jgi:acetylornithine deacetylase/succinyl-diaminopimelate desuccinylase-like protein
MRLASVSRTEPAAPSAVVAAALAYARSPVFLRAGGTIPAVSMLRTVLGLPPLLMGFGLPDDGIHGPNERLHLPTFWRGVETCIWLLAELAGGVERDP